MNVDRAVLSFAGVMVLASVALTLWVSPWFLLLTGFVGLNMLQAAFTASARPRCCSASSAWLRAVRSNKLYLK